MEGHPFSREMAFDIAKAFWKILFAVAWAVTVPIAVGWFFDNGSDFWVHLVTALILSALAAFLGFFCFVAIQDFYRGKRGKDDIVNLILAIGLIASAAVVTYLY
jgi:hypothetical protein